MFLRHLDDYTPTDEDETLRSATTTGRNGPDPRYHIAWIRQNTPGPDRRTRLKPGDVILRISDDNTQLHPPAVVDTDPHRIPHTHSAVAYRLRVRTDLEPISVTDVARSLADHGHPNPRLHHDHRIISPPCGRRCCDCGGCNHSSPGAPASLDGWPRRVLGPSRSRHSVRG